MKKIGIKSHTSDKEVNLLEDFVKIFQNSPIPQEQIFENLGLFLKSKDLSRILFLNHIYKKILDVQGVVFDFGTRWGQNMAVFSALRGIYEPFNRHRKIVGFDTFSGFPKVSKQDGKSDLMKSGNVTVSKNYEQYLEEIMAAHEASYPLSHIKKYEIIKGDASVTIKKYLARNPETIVSLAYFDFDIYKPTKDCLQAIKPHLVKGAVLAFDELNDHDSPGETLALKELFNLSSISLKRYPYASRVSYFVVN